MKKENSKKLVNVFYKKEDLDKNALKNIMVSKKGLVEIRDLGPIRFHIPIDHVPGYEDITLGVTTVQKIPIQLLMEIMSFFSYIYTEMKTEAGALIVYDITDKKYKVIIPEQTVSGASTKWDINKSIDSSREVPIMELHSHPWGDSAHVSSIDDKDELDSFGLFAVTGDFEKLIPIRATNGGKSLPVNISDVFEFAFPEEWIKNVKITKIEAKTSTAFFGNNFKFPYGASFLKNDFEVVEGINHPRELPAEEIADYAQDMEDQIDMLTDRIMTIAQEDDKILIAIAQVLDTYDTNDEFNKNRTHWDWR